MATDPNTLVLNQILAEIQKLNTFEKESQREAQSISQVARADAQVPVPAGLIRQAGPGAQLAGALSANASTPQLLDQDALAQTTRQMNDQAANAQVSGQRQRAPIGLNADPEAEEAVAWSLLGEAGVGGPLGRVRQAQYSIGKNLSYIQGGVGWAQNRLPGMTGPTKDNPTGTGPLAPVQSAMQFAQNHELATTLGIMAISTAGNNIHDWYEQGAALGYGGGYGVVGGFGRALTNAPSRQEGEAISQLVYQLRGAAGVTGLPAGARIGQGLSKDDARALVGQLFEQGYTATPGFRTGGIQGNLGEISRGLAPAVAAMGQQGAEIAGSWTQVLRSSGDSLSDLTQMLEQMPAAAKASQLGLQGVNQALQQVAGTVTSMGGTAGQGLRMGQQFMQQYPGLNPQDLSGLLSSPIVQAFGLSQGVLPSGISALPGGQVNELTQNAVRMVTSALHGLAPRQQYTTLPDGTRVPMNDPQAMVLQQAASQFFPGVSPQDLARILNQNPRRQAAVSQIQSALGQTSESSGGGQATGLEWLTGGGQPERWDTLSAHQQRQAVDYWRRNIAPTLSEAGLTSAQLQKINGTTNISRRAELLNQDLYGAGKQGAGQPGNAATVKVEIGLTSQAAKLITAKTPKAQAKMWQNAGGSPSNSIFNSAVGQNPFFSDNGLSLNGNQPGMSLNGNQPGMSLGGG